MGRLRALPMGCIATQIAWHHPDTADLTIDAGIAWLSRVAGLNPATSQVTRAWDCADQYDWEFAVPSWPPAKRSGHVASRRQPRSFLTKQKRLN